MILRSPGRRDLVEGGRWAKAVAQESESAVWELDTCSFPSLLGEIKTETAQKRNDSYSLDRKQTSV